jgi:hypothetical protein
MMGDRCRIGLAIVHRHRNGSKAVGLNLWADRSRRLLPPVYPQQLAHQLGVGGDGFMNALGLSFEIRVEPANDDPGMRRLCSVQSDEMQAI